MRIRPYLATLTLVATALATSLALPALAAPKKPAPAAPKDDPAAIAHKQFLEAIKDGSAKYEAKDIAAAIEAFQKATALEPRNPVGYYYLGEAQLGNKDLPQAESAWLHASQVSDEGGRRGSRSSRFSSSSPTSASARRSGTTRRRPGSSTEISVRSIRRPVDVPQHRRRSASRPSTPC